MTKESKYISVENAVKTTWMVLDGLGYAFDENPQLKETVSAVFDTVPAADARPVVRGKWKPRDLTWGRSYYYCSACEETVDMPTAMGIPMFRFCPNCGADMREES